jgi:hypothetical protein
MYFYRARYYDPKVGRFVTKDPIGFDGGDYNLYAFVKNNSINKTDPMGLADNWPWYGGWPWNGSPVPGYGGQDKKCSVPEWLAGALDLDKNACRKSCCYKHDMCYKKYGCNMSSWLGSSYIIPGPCQLCNTILLGCLASTIGDTSCCTRY